MKELTMEAAAHVAGGDGGGVVLDDTALRSIPGMVVGWPRVVAVPLVPPHSESAP